MELLRPTTQRGAQERHRLRDGLEDFEADGQVWGGYARRCGPAVLRGIEWLLSSALQTAG